MKINKFTILIALIPFIVDFRGIPSWASYPVVILIGLFSIKKLKLDTGNGFIMAMFLLVITGLFRFEQYSVNLFKDLGLMAFGIFPFVFKNEFKVEARSVNTLMIIGFSISVASSIFNFKFSFNNFINSQFGIERGASTYTLGLFSIYWIMKKNLKWSLLNFFFMFLGGKRIAMASIGICLLAALYFRNKEGEARLLWKIILAAGVIVYLRFSYLYAKGAYNDLIYEYTKKSADAFAMGRQQLFSLVFKMTPDPNFWGVGPGNTLDTLKMFLGQPRMHNDFLKIYSENGIFIGATWLWLCVRKIRNSQMPTILFIFALFTTTNTMIYVYMLFMFGMFLNPDKYMYIGEITMPENMHEKRIKEKLAEIKRKENLYR